MATWTARALLTVAIVVSGLAAATPTAASGGLCVPVRGTGTGQDMGDFHTEATIFVAGIPVGTTEAVFTPTGGTGTTVTFTGPIDFSARFGIGSFSVPATGSVDVSTGSFRATGEITAGTGVFRNVSGVLTFDGTQDLTTGAFTETVTGRLCVPHGNRAGAVLAPTDA